MSDTSPWLSRMRVYTSNAVFIALNIFLFLFLVRFFIVDYARVSGSSMKPQFQDGDYFLVMKLPLFFRPLRRYETVQLVNPRSPDSVIMKRIIGLPGETVVFRHNNVCVSGPKSAVETCLTEPYLDPDSITLSRAIEFSSVIVPMDAYYVLGDNRVVSTDSREIGPIPRTYILGVALSL